MPYNWNGNYAPSKADRSTDILGQKEIEGQLIYHPFRYKDYILANDNEEYCDFPVCKPGYEPDFPSDDSLSGRGLPFFEKFKNIHSVLDIDVSPAGGNLIKEMELYAEYQILHPAKQPPDGEFAEEAYDYYGELLNKLIERIPDFNIRLKVNPKTNRIEFSIRKNTPKT